jgi:hypothetical protein
MVVYLSPDTFRCRREPCCLSQYRDILCLSLPIQIMNRSILTGFGGLDFLYVLQVWISVMSAVSQVIWQWSRALHALPE